MRKLLFGLLALVLFGCAPGSANVQNQTEQTDMLKKVASLPDLGLAPELKNTAWLNVDSPLRLADLRGKVVIVEMWTFGCINCQHVMPALKDWHAKYKDQGLVIIG